MLFSQRHEGKWVMEERTYWWHFWDRSIEYLLYKHRGVVINIINLDNKFRWWFQWPVVSSVNNESCQLIFCFLFSVQPLKGIYITTGLFHFKDGIGIFTFNNVLSVVVPYTRCDLEGIIQRDKGGLWSLVSKQFLPEGAHKYDWPLLLTQFETRTALRNCVARWGITEQSSSYSHPGYRMKNASRLKCACLYIKKHFFFYHYISHFLKI